MRVIFTCVVHKATANVGTRVLNMCHQAQKGFRGIFVGIQNNNKGYLVYVPDTRKLISSYGVVFDESFSSALAYTSQSYAKDIDMHLSVSYTHYGTSSREQTGDIVTFAFSKRGIYDLKHRVCSLEDVP